MKVCQYCASPVPEGTFLCPNCGAHEFDNKCPRCGTLYAATVCPQCGLAADAEQHRCPNCGTRFYEDVCPKCGFVPKSPFSIQTDETELPAEAVSPKKRSVALLLAFFLGIYGVHRFYAGKIGSGALYLCTVGLFGIGWLIDLVMIAAGQFRDSNGLPIVDW